LFYSLVHKEFDAIQENERRQDEFPLMCPFV
jgi:hypothetical protein